MPSLGFSKGPRRGSQTAQGTVSVTPPSLTTGITGTVAIPIAGVKAKDIVVLEPPTALEAGLVFNGVIVGNGTVTALFYNPTAGTVTGIARNWTYKVLHRA